jgi:hypothetical protein
MHCFKKKKSKWCRFERHLKSSSSPGRAEDRGRRSYYVPLQRHYFPLSLPSLAQKYTTQPIPTLTCYHDKERRRHVMLGLLPLMCNKCTAPTIDFSSHHC